VIYEQKGLYVKEVSTGKYYVFMKTYSQKRRYAFKSSMAMNHKSWRGEWGRSSPVVSGGGLSPGFGSGVRGEAFTALSQADSCTVARNVT